jgi:hypothetical protein
MPRPPHSPCLVYFYLPDCHASLEPVDIAVREYIDKLFKLTYVSLDSCSARCSQLPSHNKCWWPLIYTDLGAGTQPSCSETNQLLYMRDQVMYTSEQLGHKYRTAV